MKQTKAAATGLRRYRAFFAAAMIALVQASVASPATAQDEEQPRWFGDSFDNKAILAFGIPDSDYIALAFACEQGKPVVDINVQDEESEAEEGDRLTVRLTADGEKIEFSEKAILNQDSGGVELTGHLPLNDTLRRILAAKGVMEIVVDGHAQRYEMKGAAEPVAAMIAACDAPKPVNDLDVKVTNKASLPLHSFGYSEAGVNAFDSDRFGYEPLAPGASRTFTIPAGRDICTFDISVLFVEDDEECCSMGKPAGTQNLCENGEFVVHD